MASMRAASDTDPQQSYLKGFFKQFTIPKKAPAGDRVGRQAAGPACSQEFHFAIFCKRVDVAPVPTAAQSPTVPKDDNLHIPIERDIHGINESPNISISDTMAHKDKKPPVEYAGRQASQQGIIRNGRISGYFQKVDSTSVSPASEHSRRSYTPASTASNDTLKRKHDASANETPSRRSKSPRTASGLEDVVDTGTTRSKSPRQLASIATGLQPSSSILSELPSRSPSVPTDLPSATQQSLPMSSAQSRSKAVRSSQSDEDDEDTYVLDPETGQFGSDSESSEEDLNAYFARRRKAANSVLASNEVKQEGHGSTSTNPRLRSSRLRNRQSISRTFEQPIDDLGKRKSYKISLMKLVEQAKKDSTAQVEFDKVYAEITAPDTEDPGSNSTNAAAIPNESLLATLVKDSEDGEDQVGRMLQAMTRIDAFQTDTAWYFFKGTGEGSLQKPPNFPSISEKSPQLAALQNRGFRDQAFMSGFAQDMINGSNMSQEVSLDICKWMWDSFFTEAREDLARGYLNCMKSCYTHWDHAISVDDINHLLKSLNAFDESINFEQDLVPNQKLDPTLTCPNVSLIIRILDAFKTLQANLTADARMQALGILLRLGLDKHVTRTAEIQIALRSSLIALADHISSDREDGTIYLLAANLYTHLSHPILQHRLIDTIPPSSQRLHLLRRRLALAFFLNDSSMLANLLEHPLQQQDTPTIYRTANPHVQDGPDLSTRVICVLQESPHFDTTDVQLDYSVLAAYISMLDIAIDCGFAVSPNREETEAKTLKEPVDVLSMKAKHDKSLEASFNSSVDALVAEVDGLWARISDTGASHMTRTDAKNVLERLKRRLEYAVRTKVRKRKSIFEGGGRNFGRSSLSATVDSRLNGFEDEGFGDVQRKFMENIFVKPMAKDDRRVADI